jgi:hypothetical protein
VEVLVHALWIGRAGEDDRGLLEDGERRVLPGGAGDFILAEAMVADDLLRRWQALACPGIDDPDRLGLPGWRRRPGGLGGRGWGG